MSNPTVKPAPQTVWGQLPPSSYLRFSNNLRVLSLEFIVGFLVFAAIYFNILLAFLNAKGFGIDRADVIICEVLIVGMALVVCLLAANRLMIPWFGAIWLMMALFIGLVIIRHSVDPKFLRDVILIPVFIMLGLAYSKGNIIKLFCALQATILAFMLLEGIFPQTFSDIFAPWDYYLRTRWSGDSESWHPETGLFISSFRPGGRLIFDWLGIHRLSSVFLEPVSLGNWCIIVTIFIMVFWRSASPAVRVFLIVSNFALLVGSDGRLAMASSLLIVVLSVLAPRLPRYLYFWYLPGVIVAAFAFVMIVGFEPFGDTFAGRIGRSVALLAALDFPAYLGIDPALIERSADTGISYLILTQSVFGAIALWAAICYLNPPNSRPAVVLMHGICAYISLLLMVSYSLFTIKTAAPLWLIYGYVHVKGFLGDPLDSRKSEARRAVSLP